MRALTIAIDGPAGAGKSTVSKLLANKIGARLLDTGAFYRTITLAAMQKGIDAYEITDEFLNNLDIAQTSIDGRTCMFLDGKDVSDDIRRETVSRAVSLYSTIEKIRNYAVGLQQAFIQKNLDESTGVVIEGRDIATVVAPNADLKIFLTASPEIRAHRRSLELSANQDETLENILERDRLDVSREISPLRKATDAIEIDATDKSPTDIVEIIYELSLQVKHDN